MRSAIPPSLASERRSRLVAVVAALAVIAAVAVTALAGAGPFARADEDAEADAPPSASVELRIWQSVRAPLALWISARPEAGAPWTTVPLGMAAPEGGGSRSGGLTVAARDGAIELRVRQDAASPGLVHLSARPAGGSWDEYGTQPVELAETSRSGRFRYADVRVALRWPDAAPPLPGDEAPALCIPEGLATARLQARVWRSVAAPPRYWISSRPADDASWSTSAVTLAAGGDGWSAGGLTVAAGAARFELRLWARADALHLSARVARATWDEYGTRPLALDQTSRSGRTTYADLVIDLTLPRAEPPDPGVERTWACPEPESTPTPTPTPTPEPNEPPRADAGARQIVNAGDTVTLDGSGSDDPDGDALAFAWTQTGGSYTGAVALTGAATATPTFTAGAALSGQTIVFTLTVTDPAGLTASDTVEIEVRPQQVALPPQPSPNQPPVADAGDDQSVDRGDDPGGQLDGSGSSDPDGDTLTYEWTPPTGITLNDASAVKPTFTIPADAAIGAQYTFTLEVTDNHGLSDTDTVVITAKNALPTVDATAGSEAPIPEAGVSLSATADDPDGSQVSWKWEIANGSATLLSRDDAAAITLNVPAGATKNHVYTLTATATDEDGGKGADSFTVTVTNTAPTANAGADQSVARKSGVTLGSSDSPDPDDGDTLTFTWSPSDGLSSTSVQQPTFTVPTDAAIGAQYTFTLTVSDGKNSDTDSVTITAKNAKPTVTASVPSGSAEPIPGAQVGLSATAADPDGSEITWKWVLADEPTSLLRYETTATPTLVIDDLAAKGKVYRLTVTVEDEDGGKGTDNLSVTVTNTAPVADAGDDQSVNRKEKVTLDGSGSTDGDNDTLTYTWSAPTGITLDTTSPSRPTFTVAEDAALNTQYAFSLTVSDGTNSDSDSVKVTVVNAPPTLTMGGNKTGIPGASVQAGTSATDPDGDDAKITWEWALAGGPTSLLSGTDTATPTLAIPAGAAKDKVYTLTATATDEDDGTSTGSFTVTVTNTAPTADAGDDQSLNRGHANAELDGSGSSDDDGDTLTYAWSQTAGTTVTLSSTSAAKRTFTVPIGAAANERLTFRLTVSDGAGKNSDTDSVTITALNVPPTLTMGEDQTGSAGTSVQITGTTADDPDGDNSKITWLWGGAPTSQLTGAETGSPTLNIPAGTTTNYTLTLTVTDEDGGTASGSLTVTVQ